MSGAMETLGMSAVLALAPMAYGLPITAMCSNSGKQFLRRSLGMYVLVTAVLFMLVRRIG